MGRGHGVSWLSVRDVAAHLLHDDLRRLSRSRDHVEGPVPKVGESLPTFLNRANDRWVKETRFLSPRLLVDLLIHTPTTSAREARHPRPIQGCDTRRCPTRWRRSSAPRLPGRRCQPPDAALRPFSRLPASQPGDVAAPGTNRESWLRRPIVPSALRPHAQRGRGCGPGACGVPAVEVGARPSTRAKVMRQQPPGTQPVRVTCRIASTIRSRGSWCG